MSRERRASRESRMDQFSASVSAANPEHGREFASLTHAGQQMYASMRYGDGGYDHETAFRDSKVAHGLHRN